VRTSWFLLPLALLALVACSDPLAGLPNEFPPSITLVASRLEGEAAFDVTLSAHASDADGNNLAYAWRVDGELITQATDPTLRLTFFEAGAYEVAVSVTDGLHEASASVTITARNDYRPAEAPDVVIIGFAGRCNVLKACFPPADNRAYLSEAPIPNTLQAMARTFEQLGHSTLAFSFRSHLLDSPTLGPGYLSADALLEFVRDEWIRDFKDPTRVVLVAHSHGNQFMSLLAWDHPEVEFAYGIYLDAVCTAWDADHIHSGMFRDAYGSQQSFPRPLNLLGGACDTMFVPGVGYQDISDVAPWNIRWALEVRSAGVAWTGLVADDDPNHRPDGTSGISAGMAGIYTDEGHNDVHRDGGAALQWVLDTLAHNGLPLFGATGRARSDVLHAQPAPSGFSLDR
jgi:hypothetical protein